jgi:transcriptional regulator with XRE-family HTH domain
MAFSPAQCRAARNLLNWTQFDLAGHSKLTEKTIADYERGATRPHARTLSKMEEAFKTAGIEFLNSDAPGVRLRVPREAKRPG